MKRFLIVKAAIVALGMTFILCSAPAIGARYAPAEFATVPVYVAGDDKCATMSDQQQADAIYANIAKKYPNEANHVNVYIEAGVANVRGWVSSEKIKKSVIKMVKKDKCVKTVNDYLVVGKGGGCAPDQQNCGGTCIPKTERCNTRG